MTIQEALLKNKLSMDNFREVFDFGCGCGRIIRHWKSFEKTRFFGSDYNHTLISWCKHNLSFASFIENRLYPPLDFCDGKFDFIYAISVFTHMTIDLQTLWLDELARVLKSNGYLLISLHGESFYETLRESEKQDFREGKLVVRFADSAGTNLCGAYHPKKYVSQKLLNRFKLVDHIDHGAAGTGFQDYYLLGKK